MENKTKEEMEALAKEMFGEQVFVTYNDGWVIETGVEESFDPEAHKDRPAYHRYHETDGGENSLERWARKNGHGSESMADLFDSYDAEMESQARETVATVRRKVADGWEFDWAGGPEWRDEVLAYGEEKGW